MTEPRLDSSARDSVNSALQYLTGEAAGDRLPTTGGGLAASFSATENRGNAVTKDDGV